MGIRPHLYFGVAISVTNEEREYIPDGWPDEWQEIEMFSPTPQEVENAYDAYLKDESNFDRYIECISVDSIIRVRDGDKLGDRLVYDAEYGLSNIAFYVVDEAKYDADVLWAASAVYQNYDKCCNEFIELPKMEPEKDCSEDARLWVASHKPIRTKEFADLIKKHHLQIERYQRWVDEDHLYVQFRYYMDMYFAEAEWIMNRVLQVTPRVQRKDLKLGIYWKWS